MDPRTGLDHVEKRKSLTIPGFERRPLDRPARSQSLYRLRYPGSLILKYIVNKNIVMLQSDFVWFRIETNHGLLKTH
jgi:hypothetical protein